jgi:hypothetical protein
VTGPVRITHPFHPRFGQEIDFVFHRHNWGENRVYFREESGHLASLPARWTNVCRRRLRRVPWAPGSPGTGHVSVAGELRLGTQAT